MISSYKNADTSILRLARIFSQAHIECGFIVPSQTALKKYTIDAIQPVRKLFEKNQFHDFRTQLQGKQNKVEKECWIVDGEKKSRSKISLYRPNTKAGDPRMWISMLHKLVSPNNVLALFFWNGSLHLVNCSKPDIEADLEDPNTILGTIRLQQAKKDPSNIVSEELLAKLKCIGSRGPIKSLRTGPTGIGFTLETLLGIAANSDKRPDYKGIELKASRSISPRGTNTPREKISLFSKVPSRKLSPLTASEALDLYGYYSEENRQQLYCSVDAALRNSLGFILDHSQEDDALLAKNDKNQNSKDRDVFVWELNTLREAFSKKHKETFWIGAKTEKKEDGEWFHYKNVRHTKHPSISVFEICLLTGGICVDLTLSRLETGRVRDHGYLFRVKREAFSELFPEPKIYEIG